MVSFWPRSDPPARIQQQDPAGFELALHVGGSRHPRERRARVEIAWAARGQRALQRQPGGPPGGQAAVEHAYPLVPQPAAATTGAPRRRLVLVIGHDIGVGIDAGSAEKPRKRGWKR